MAWQHISSEVTVKGFKKCCITKTLDETDDDMLWKGREGGGMLRVSVQKMKALTVKMEIVDTDW
jgi:hypothetical protein